MKVLYRISEKGYAKNKPDYINNKNCFSNARKIFKNAEFFVLADNVDRETLDFLSSFEAEIKEINVGNGAGTFNLALDYALKLNPEEIVYFLENDYIHRLGSQEVLQEAFDSDTIFDYSTLYDHPDKYLNPHEGGNPMCYGKGEETKVFFTGTCHWKYTNSTTMTFASRVETLLKDEKIIRKWTSDTHPHDFNMFLELGNLGRKLISPIPGFSTHGEVEWMSPLINWQKVCEETCGDNN